MTTLMYASFLGLLFLFLSINVVRGRGKHKVNLGTGPDGVIEPAVRAHGNFAEYVPVTLIIIALYEVQLHGEGQIIVHCLGGALLLARILHAWGLLSASGPSVGRVAGTLLTWVVLATACVLSLIRILA